jgi:gamma-glutamyl-gamma-aminobutyraldehyde dehydrogenase
MSMIEEGRGYADCVTGGNAMQVDGKGYFVEPTIFNDVPPASQLAKEEIFGPVLSVIPV